MAKSRIRVAILGCGGLLGSRISTTAQVGGDLDVSVGTIRFDPTLERTLQVASLATTRVFPGKVFVNGSSDDVRKAQEYSNKLQWRTEGAKVQFESIDDLSLSDLADVVVDATPVGLPSGRAGRLDQFQGPIIYQDGVPSDWAPLGQPPLLPKGKRVRLGGCLLSGTAPMFAAFQDLTSECHVSAVMQVDERGADYLIFERISQVAFVSRHASQLNQDLRRLFPGVDVRVPPVVQIPGRVHYALTFSFTLNRELQNGELDTRLAGIPHSMTLDGEACSTYGVNLAESLDTKFPPLLIFRDAVHSEGRSLTIPLALGYRYAAVLPNLDAIRAFGHGIDALSAMRMTDASLGFAK